MAVAVVWCALVALGCGGDRDRGITVDSGPGVGGDGATAFDGGSPGPTDAGPPIDAAPATAIDCTSFEGPTLVVTRHGDGTGTSLLRAALRFDGAATDVRITEVSQLDTLGETVRDWDPSTVSGPAGFDGRVVPRDGDPSPTVLFTATDAATTAELASCDVRAWERGGRVVVRGSTAETGAFETTCGLSTHLGADATVAFACASGVAGWMTDTYDGITNANTPVGPYVFADAPITVHNVAGGAVDGFAVTGATVSAYDASFGAACPVPEDWEITGGTHVLWHGTSSENVWSGPVAPGDEYAAWWGWQSPGSAPDGLCILPDLGVDPPKDDCYAPVLQFSLRGVSSQGPWAWESDLFHCYLTPDGG